MLCVKLKEFAKICGGVSGGISDVAIFDPSDFNFTQATASDPYSAVALRDGATAANGGKMFRIQFQVNEAERTWKQTRAGASVKYDHEFKMQLPQLSQNLTTFLESLDAAGTCCGLGLILRHNDGRIFVAGEKFVNSDEIPNFLVLPDGSDGASGKTFDNFNGANVLLKASYTRDLYEYTGTWASITALM
jgi:hypothetical protein